MLLLNMSFGKNQPLKRTRPRALPYRMQAD